jgi:hypothetical protein
MCCMLIMHALINQHMVGTMQYNTVVFGMLGFVFASTTTSTAKFYSTGWAMHSIVGRSDQSIKINARDL